MNTIKIDFVSDIVCPWCAIGFQELKKTQQKLKNEVTLEINLIPLEVNPGLEKTGMKLSDHLMHMAKGDHDRAEGIKNHVVSLGKQAGFTFNFNDNTRIYNTQLAHKLINLAQKQNQHMAVYYALLTAYFTEGQDISCEQTLLKVARAAKLPLAQAQDVISSQEEINEIAQSSYIILEKGISSVPTVIIENNTILKDLNRLTATVRQLNQERIPTA